MSQPYGPPPGLPYPQSGSQQPGSGPPPQQPYPGSGPLPQQGYPASGPLPQQHPGSGPLPQQGYPASGPLPQQPYPGSGPLPQQHPPPYPQGPPQQPPHPQQPRPGQPQPGYPQQGYPQQPQQPAQFPLQPQPVQPQLPIGTMLPPPPAGMGRILLDASYHKLAFTTGMFKPGITINGTPGPQARWGKNAIDLPPGQYQLEVHVKYLWKFGAATAVIPVQPGRQLDAYYRPPMTAFGGGALGPTPQSTPNVSRTIAITVLAMLLGALCGVLLSGALMS